ncbi:MAG: hypothetical protein GY810_07105 [Aureispira sp.]|nr:hypothetical protein [Aureispira sp.]
MAIGRFDAIKISELINLVAATSSKVSAKGPKHVLHIYMTELGKLSNQVKGGLSIQEAKILAGTVSSFYKLLKSEYTDSVILLEKGNRYRKNIQAIEVAARQFQSKIKGLAVEVLKNGLKILGIKHADKIAGMFKVLLDSAQEIVGERLILKGQSVTASQVFDIVVTKATAHIVNGQITKIADKLTKRFQSDAQLGFIKTQTGNGVGWVKDAVNIMFAKGTIPSKSDVRKAFKKALSKFGDKFTSKLDSTIYDHLSLVALSIIKEMIFDQMKKQILKLK